VDGGLFRLFFMAKGMLRLVHAIAHW
jgi:hypothetical protein